MAGLYGNAMLRPLISDLYTQPGWATEAELKEGRRRIGRVER